MQPVQSRQQTWTNSTQKRWRKLLTDIQWEGHLLNILFDGRPQPFLAFSVLEAEKEVSKTPSNAGRLFKPRAHCGQHGGSMMTTAPGRTTMPSVGRGCGRRCGGPGFS